jgi:hypothetical protein
LSGERTSVGLDVQARSVAAAAIDAETGEVKQARLTSSHQQIVSWIARLPAAWHHRPAYRLGKTMRNRWDLAPVEARARAMPATAGCTNGGSPSTCDENPRQRRRRPRTRRLVLVFGRHEMNRPH